MQLPIKNTNHGAAETFSFRWHKCIRRVLLQSINPSYPVSENPAALTLLSLLQLLASAFVTEPDPKFLLFAAHAFNLH
jgi:hypothetical protein